MGDLPSSTESESKPAPDDDPLMLLVGTTGIELQPMLLAGHELAYGTIHIAQPWNPVVCSCGKLHTADEKVFLTLQIGSPQSTLRTNPASFTLALVPDLDQPPIRGVPFVAPEPGSGSFQEWSSKVVAHFTDFFAFGCMCVRWDNIRILWDPASDLCGCGERRDPYQQRVPACLPEHARLRFASEPAPDSLSLAMERLLDRTPWITPRCRRLMVTLSLAPENGLLSDGWEAEWLLIERTREQAKILSYMPVAPRGLVPMLSLLGG